LEVHNINLFLFQQPPVMTDEYAAYERFKTVLSDPDKKLSGKDKAFLIRLLQQKEAETSGRSVYQHETERRFITVIFADISGFTYLSHLTFHVSHA
jgi:hypothetical protein